MDEQNLRDDNIATRNALRDALKECRGAFVTVAVFSFVVNLFILVMPIYMFSVFTRGLSSFNMATLAALFMILATLTIVLPMTTTIPSVALSLLAVGLLQRDGLFVIGGAVVATAWIGLLTTLAVAFLLGADWAMRLVTDHVPGLG